MYLFRKEKKEPFALLSDEEAQAWAIERAPGKWRWILKHAMVYAVLMFSGIGLCSVFFGFAFDISLFGLVFYIPTGIILGFLGWNPREYAYRRYMNAKSPGEPPKEAFLTFEN